MTNSNNEGRKTDMNTNESSKQQRNMREEIRKPPIPFYAVGVFWLIYALVFPMYRIFDFIIAGVLSIIVYFIVNKLTPSTTIMVPIKEEPIHSGDETVDDLIADGLAYLRQIKQANDAITNEKITVHITRMEVATDKIFRYIAKHPEDAPQIRRFMNYYLPTLLKLLNSYISLNEQGIKGGHISSTIENIEGILSTIADAFEKQLDNLFADDALDISTDIKVLETMLAQEGLTSDGFKK